MAGKIEQYKNDMQAGIQHKINEAVFNFTQLSCIELEKDIKKAIADYAMQDGMSMRTMVSDINQTTVTTISISIDATKIMERS